MNDTEQAAAIVAEAELTLSLDRERPFGTIHGEHEGSYEQDGFVFDVEGELIAHLVKDRARLAKQVRMVQARENAAAAYREAMGADAPANMSVQFIDRDANAEIDLAAWAAGKVRIQFHKVQAQMRERYGQVPTSRADALAILKAENVVG